MLRTVLTETALVIKHVTNGVELDGGGGNRRVVGVYVIVVVIVIVVVVVFEVGGRTVAEGRDRCRSALRRHTKARPGCCAARSDADTSTAAAACPARFEAREHSQRSIQCIADDVVSLPARRAEMRR
jgi:hypothetical protein